MTQGTIKPATHRQLAQAAALLLLSSLSLFAQPEIANYDEAKVPDYTLPDPLVLANGKPVSDAGVWYTDRRPEILTLFEDHVYGRAPAPPEQMGFEIISIDKQALGGKAVRKQIAIQFSGDKDGPGMDLLIYVPAAATKPVPAFLGLNFQGNHSIHTDTGIKLSTSWMRNRPDQGVVNHRATAASRGVAASRWQVEMILERGYAVATIYYGDIDPDYDDGFQNGVHPLFYKDAQTKPGPGEWGSIAAWAWGLSRAMDYFENDGAIDQANVALLGHSRLGKTSLWAGAQDTRFGLVISNNSGCGGAALSRRRFGETVERINTRFPHWFADNFNQYNDNEDALPIDQHMLIALIAPRSVYVASAEDDQWADPRGEFLAAKHAEPVYRLLGVEGLGTDAMPAVNQPVAGAIGYHIRSGKHDVTDYDWQQYLDFADKQFGKTR